MSDQNTKPGKKVTSYCIVSFLFLILEWNGGKL